MYMWPKDEKNAGGFTLVDCSWKCNCNSIKIHHKAALILMHVRVHNNNGGRKMATSDPNCQLPTANCHLVSAPSHKG